MLFKIAFRNIFRQKRRTVLTALTMFGGFTLAAISIGWADGSYNFVINMFTRNQLGHIQIHAKDYRNRPSLYKTINDYDDLGQQLTRIPGVESWTPRLFTAGLVSVKDRSSAAQIIGIDPQRENRTTNFAKKIASGHYFSGQPVHEVIVGKGLAKILQAVLGDTLVIVSQAADGSIANDLYTIIGLVESGADITDRTSLYLNLQEAQELFMLEKRVHEIAVLVTSLNDVETVVKRIENQIHDNKLEVVPWQVFAKSFYQAMMADKQGMWIMLLIILIVVAVGVLNTILMSVLERQKEYGLLKAIGTRPKSIVIMVLYEVVILALISIVIGTMLSLLINHALSINGVTLPQPINYGGMEFHTMYTEVNARSIYIPAFTIILVAVLVSLFPAIRAAKTEAAQAMRTN
jgi:putative ABC transport system permease protein